MKRRLSKARVKKLRLIKPGDTVPATGLYRVQKGTRIKPVRKGSR